MWCCSSRDNKNNIQLNSVLEFDVVEKQNTPCIQDEIYEKSESSESLNFNIESPEKKPCICSYYSVSSSNSSDSITDNQEYTFYLGYTVGDEIIVKTKNKLYTMVISILYKSCMVLTDREKKYVYYLAYENADSEKKIFSADEDPFMGNNRTTYFDL